MKAFTAACAQFAVVPNEPAANVAACVTWIRRAAQENGAQLIVLPETITTGFTPRMSAEALWDLMDTLPGRWSEPIQQAARDLSVHVVFATYERGPTRGVVFNAAALIGPGAMSWAFIVKPTSSPQSAAAAAGGARQGASLASSAPTWGALA